MTDASSGVTFTGEVILATSRRPPGTNARALLVAYDAPLRAAPFDSRAEIHFDAKVAWIRARNTKGNKPRVVPLSDRLIDELKTWCEKAKSDDAPILPQYDHKKAWKAVKKEAGITDDLQLRDLRGWGTSRIAKALAAAQLPWQWGMKATGHTQTRTYERYISVPSAEWRRHRFC